MAVFKQVFGIVVHDVVTANEISSALFDELPELMDGGVVEYCSIMAQGSNIVYCMVFGSCFSIDEEIFGCIEFSSYIIFVGVGRITDVFPVPEYEAEN